MRIYYGAAEDVKNYIEDAKHKVVAWKEGPVSYKLTNSTQFTLIITVESDSPKIQKLHKTLKPR